MSTFEAFKNIVEELSKDPETEEKLTDLRKEIADAYVQKLKTEKSDLLLSLGEDIVADYLVDEGFSDKLHDHLVEKALESVSSLSSDLKSFREKLKKSETEEELNKLKSEIGVKNLENQTEASEEEVNTPTGLDNAETEASENSENQTVASDINNENLLEDTDFSGFEEQKPYIEKILSTAAAHIGKPYVRGGTGWKGFDCSGLRNYAFEKNNVDFEGRFTASLFAKTDVNIEKEQVRVGDFMYWEQKPNSKKHNPIYHIEMVVDKPIFQDGKRFVKTLGSSTDKGVLDDTGNKTNKSGVGYRLREINTYRHFGRPPYYVQLAEHEASNNQGKILATTKKVSENMEEKVLS